MSQHTPARSPICYRLDAGRLIVRDGVPFATLHGVRPYEPVELDAFAREVVATLNTAPELLATLRGIRAHVLTALESDGVVFVDETHLLNVCDTAIAHAEGGE